MTSDKPASPVATIEELRLGVLARERRALAKTITLLESQHPEHQERAGKLLDALLPNAGGSLRIGVTGTPGVGKSTFIERLGLALIEQGHRLAVLAIDPSSSVSGGSILGDKTRMERLSVHPAAFVRPSPAGGTLGGAAARTREVMLVCEAAGYDVLIVETVGVGQSESAVAGMTDVFVLLQLPNAGDELQAMKKGVVELADFIVVNKADLDPTAAERAARQVSSILQLLRPSGPAWQPEVLTISALTGAGIAELWARIVAHRDAMRTHGQWQEKRRRQALAWMWQIIDARLQGRFRASPAVQSQLDTITSSVASGKTSATAAAARLLALFES